MKYLLFLVLALVMWSCGGNGAQSNSTEEESIAEVLKPEKRDSLRKRYTERLAKLDSPMPLKQVLEKGKVNPVDEAPLDTTFFLLRENLKDAVAKRDIFFVRSIVDEDIKCSFGAEHGLTGFVQIWGLDTPAKTEASPLWGVLEKLLKQGGVFSNGGKRFTMPYLFATFPNEYDSFEYGAILGSGVRLRESPNLSSQILKNISYDVVKIIERTPDEMVIDGESYPWIKVEMLDGLSGFVYGKFVGQPIGFRAIFEKKAGKWKMTVLIAGD